MASKARAFIAWCSLLLLLLLASVPPLPAVSAASSDAEALLELKASIDPSNALPWGRDSAGGVCGWTGVRECSPDGRVTKLVLEYLNLTGGLQGDTLAALDQLRVLSFKSNALSGKIPDVSALSNLKSLFLNNNRFTGRIPASLGTLHRLKTVVLSGNMLSGKIPASLTKLPRLRHHVVVKEQQPHVFAVAASHVMFLQSSSPAQSWPRP